MSGRSLTGRGGAAREGFSMERLCRLLTALGQDIRIVVQPSRGRGRTPLGRKLWIRRES